MLRQTIDLKKKERFVLCPDKENLSEIFFSLFHNIFLCFRLTVFCSGRGKLSFCPAMFGERSRASLMLRMKSKIFSQ